MLRDGRTLAVEAVEHRIFEGHVYNFAVNQLACYAVGWNNVLVHNTGLDCGGTGGEKAPVKPDLQPQYSQQQQGNGSYINRHQSGKYYVGKGGSDRMADSAAEKAAQYGDPVVSKTHRPAPDTKTSFIDEQNALDAAGGLGGNTYNKINSPGKKLRDGP